MHGGAYASRCLRCAPLTTFMLALHVPNSSPGPALLPRSQVSCLPHCLLPRRHTSPELADLHERPLQLPHLPLRFTVLPLHSAEHLQQQQPRQQQRHALRNPAKQADPKPASLSSVILCG